MAAYLHWVRLWLEYDRVARWDEFGRLVSDPQEVQQRARDLVLYTRSVTDMGVVHSHFHVFTGWFRYRFAGLEKIPGFSWDQTEEWKREAVSPPQAAEIRRYFEGDLRRLSELVPEAVEIVGKQFTGKMVPLAERRPRTVQAWGNVPRSPLFVESGLHLFRSAGSEAAALDLHPV